MSSVSLAIHRLEPQSARGRARLQKILEAATELFLRVGYEQTSIDAILLQSGGSKSTLYAYFPTKEDLFRAVIDSVVDNSDLGAALDISANARMVLTEFAVSRQRVVLSPRHRAVLRLVIAERERFPDLAQIYWERGPQVTLYAPGPLWREGENEIVVLETDRLGAAVEIRESADYGPREEFVGS